MTFGIRRAFGERPIHAAVIALLLLTPLLAFASYLHTKAWEASAVADAVAESDALCTLQRPLVIAGLEQEFERLRKLARLLANDPRSLEPLDHKNPATIAAFNAYLAEFASDLDLHKAYVLDADGMCVASNDFAESKTLLGKRFYDREYFTTAMAGGQGVQFVVGRVSTVPGFHFSAPIRAHGAILGVATVKIDLQTFARRIHFTSGFVTDDQGLIVLSSEPAHLMRAVPDAPALWLSREEMLLRYQLETIPVLDMTPLEAPSARLYKVGGEDGAPSIVQTVPLPKHGLTAYVFQQVEGLGSIDEQFEIRLVLGFLLLFCVFAGVVSLYAYFAREAFVRRDLLRLNEQLKELAHHDALTGCGNRREFDEAMRREAMRCSRSGRPMSLALIDLDHFKLVNDSHGHGVGDRMLAHVSSLLREGLRETDTLARIGGEEFAIILPDADEATAAQAMGRLLRLVESRPLAVGELRLAQTVSMGVAAFHGEKALEKLQQEADIALYVAKRCGRNRLQRASSLKGCRSLQDVDNVECCEDAA